MHARNRHARVGTAASFLGPLDLRAPEDQFSSDDLVQDRYHRPIASPDIDEAASGLLQRLHQRDAAGARIWADKLVRKTGAHFEMQGVPAFARPILPPQFASGIRASLNEVSPNTGGRVIQSLIDSFDPALRNGVARELQFGLAGPSATSSATSSGAPPKFDRAPTWVREPTFWESMFQRSPDRPPSGSPPRPVAEKTWRQEYQERAQAGARERQRQEAYDNFLANFGIALSPEEKLKRQLMGDVVRSGRQPVFLSGKEPHPDDPYKDRVAWPSNPNPGDQTVVVTGPFGQRTYRDDNGNIVTDFHPGVDFRNKDDKSVFSPKNGTILRIVPNAGGAGNMVYILHDDGSISAFFHTQSLQGMEEGDEVYAGQRVGRSDGSGKGPPHSHYSYFPPGTPIDPRTGLPMRGRDDHDLNAPARTQADPFGQGGPYDRPGRNRPPFRVER